MSQFSTFYDYLTKPPVFVVETPKQGNQKSLSISADQPAIVPSTNLFQYGVLSSGKITTTGGTTINCGDLGSSQGSVPPSVPPLNQLIFIGLTNEGNPGTIQSATDAGSALTEASSLAAATKGYVQSNPANLIIMDHAFFETSRTLANAWYYFPNYEATALPMKVSASINILKNAVIVCNSDLTIQAQMNAAKNVSALVYSMANVDASTSGSISCCTPYAGCVMVADYFINFTCQNVITNPLICLGAGGISMDNNTVNACVCYLKGTQILTKKGYKAIEDIKLGEEMIVCGDIEKNKYVVADDKTSKVMWLSHFKASPSEETFPVCFKKGSLAPNLPINDLYVSQGHQIVYKGQLIPAKRFVNGNTIFIDREKFDLVYYHVEVEKHSILLAEGVPAESYLETGKRHLFASKERLVKKREMKKISMLK